MENNHGHLLSRLTSAPFRMPSSSLSSSVSSVWTKSPPPLLPICAAICVTDADFCTLCQLYYPWLFRFIVSRQCNACPRAHIYHLHILSRLICVFYSFMQVVGLCFSFSVVVPLATFSSKMKMKKCCFAQSDQTESLSPVAKYQPKILQNFYGR